MDPMSNIVEAEKLSNGMWVWICTPDSGAFFQGAEHYKTKNAAIKAGEKFAELFV
jgi:hypothetical protein